MKQLLLLLLAAPLFAQSSGPPGAVDVLVDPSGSCTSPGVPMQLNTTNNHLWGCNGSPGGPYTWGQISGGGGGSTAPATFNNTGLVPTAPTVTVLAPGGVTIGYAYTLTNSIGESCTGTATALACAQAPAAGAHETQVANSNDSGAGISNRITIPGGVTLCTTALPCNIYITTAPPSGYNGLIAQCPGSAGCGTSGANRTFTDSVGNSGNSYQSAPTVDTSVGQYLNGTLRVNHLLLGDLPDPNVGNSTAYCQGSNPGGQSFPFGIGSGSTDCAPNIIFGINSDPSLVGNWAELALGSIVNSTLIGNSNLFATLSLGMQANLNVGGGSGDGFLIGENVTVNVKNAGPNQGPGSAGIQSSIFNQLGGAAGMNEIIGVLSQATNQAGAIIAGAEGIRTGCQNLGTATTCIGIVAGGTTDGGGSGAHMVGGSFNASGGSTDNIGVQASSVSGTGARDFYAADAGLTSEFAGAITLDGHTLAFIVGLGLPIGTHFTTTDGQVTTVTANVVSNATCKGSGGGGPGWIVSGGVAKCAYLP